MDTHSVLYSPERNLGLMDKQIRMLCELVDSSSVVQPEGTFAIVNRRRMDELVDLLKLEVWSMKREVETCLAPDSAATLERDLF